MPKQLRQRGKPRNLHRLCNGEITLCRSQELVTNSIGILKTSSLVSPGINPRSVGHVKFFFVVGSAVYAYVLYGLFPTVDGT